MKEARRVEREGAELRVWGPGVGRSETVGASGKAGWSEMESYLECQAKEFGFVPSGHGKPFIEKSDMLLEEE